MATVEFLQKRITGKETEIDKLNKKLARIRKAEAGGWEENNPYLYSESDLRWCLKDLEAATEALEKYKAELELTTKKESSRNVPAILEFLNLWKQRCLEYYGKGLEEVFTELATIRKLEEESRAIDYNTDEYLKLREELEARRIAYSENLRGKYEKVTTQRGGRTYTATTKVADGKWEYIVSYMGSSYEASMEKLKKALDQEANRKYDFIIERTCAIVGEITDASGLYVGAKQDLNGFIIGTNGRAKVQTIGAGGYNIQCFHFRTLINAA